MILQNRRGFTITELLVVMVIFLVIMMITAAAFKTIVDNSSQQTKSVETQIEGIVGLEVLRADMEQSGFGLPWSFSNTISYQEAASINATTTTGTLFNDSPSNPPCAILSGNTTFNKDIGNIGSTYLVIKSAVAATNDTSKKWTTVSFDSNSAKTIRVWGNAEQDFTDSERIVVVKDSLMTTPVTRQLMVSALGAFATTFSAYSTMTIPHQNGDSFQLYGISPNTSPVSSLRMPFNRTDYYVKRPNSNMPTSCASNTGILYKATLSHSDGGFISIPLLDCVADMQVVYGLDTSAAGFVNSHTTIPLTTADDMRSQLKEIRVYILAQEGRKDLTFSYPSTTVDVGESFDGGATIMGRHFNLQTLIGADYKYYRWKVYTIVVRPKNLIQ